MSERVTLNLTLLTIVSLGPQTRASVIKPLRKGVTELYCTIVLEYIIFIQSNYTLQI